MSSSLGLVFIQDLNAENMEYDCSIPLSGTNTAVPIQGHDVAPEKVLKRLLPFSLDYSDVPGAEKRVDAPELIIHNNYRVGLYICQKNVLMRLFRLTGYAYGTGDGRASKSSFSLTSLEGS